MGTNENLYEKHSNCNVLGYEERKDNEEWFDECRQLLQ